jgi:hypothetical protein
MFLGVVGVTMSPYGVEGLVAGEAKPVLEIRDVDIDLNGNGSGRVRIAFLVPDEIAATLKDGKGFASFESFGMQAVGTAKIESADGKSTIHETGEFSDILQLVKFLDSSVPFLLTSDRRFNIAWDGELLELILWRRDSRQQNAPRPFTEYRIRTSGFLIDEASTGRISENGKSVSFRLSDMNRDRLVLRFVRMKGPSK